MANFVSNDKKSEINASRAAALGGSEGETKSNSTTDGAVPAATAHTYTVLLLNNVQVQVTKLTNDPTHATECTAYEKNTRSKRNQLFSSIERTMDPKNGCWTKSTANIQCNLITEAEHFDYSAIRSGGFSNNLPSFLKRSQKCLVEAQTWLKQHIETFGALECARDHIQHVDTAMAPLYLTLQDTLDKYEIMNVRYSNSGRSFTDQVGYHPSMNNCFTGTLPGKLKQMRSYTAKQRNPDPGHERQANELYQRQLKGLLTWSILFKEKYETHRYGSSTLQQCRAECLEARRDVTFVLDETTSKLYVDFMDAPSRLPEKRTVEIEIPHGVKAGNQITVNLPNGKTVKVTVPKGMHAGNKLTVNCKLLVDLICCGCWWLLVVVVVVVVVVGQHSVKIQMNNC